MRRILIATSNAGKLRDFAGAAAPHAIEIAVIPGFASLPAVVEDGLTFEENARKKAEEYSRHAAGEIVLADDSGLEVDALGGAPGVYSARFAGPHSTDQANNQLLLERMRGVRDRSARFVCVIALLDGGLLAGIFRGVVEGEILEEARGANGFGYDPLFFYPPFGCSLGEAAAEQKLKVSHRGKALRALWQRLIK